MNHNVTTLDTDGQAVPELPCRADPELWWSDTREGVEEAKAKCLGCPIRESCLRVALERREPAGVWGGELLDRGKVSNRRPKRVAEPVMTRRDRERAARQAARKAAGAKLPGRPKAAGRPKADTDPVRVQRTVELVGARMPVGDPLTRAERLAVVGHVYPRYGLSVEQLAELLGVSPRTVSRDLKAAA